MEPTEAPAEEAQLLFSVVVEDPAGASHTVSNVNSGDVVHVVKQLIMDVPELCHHTSYHLELVRHSTDGGVVPASDTVVLNDYMEIIEYPDVKEGAVLRMVADAYDGRQSRLHIRRLRDIFDSPPRHPHGGEGEVAPPAAGRPGAEKTKGRKAQKGKDAAVPAVAQQEPQKGPADDAVAAAADDAASAAAPASAEDSTAAAEEQRQKVLALQARMPDLPIPVPRQLSAFFSASKGWATVGESHHAAGAGAAGGAIQELPTCVKSLTFSGWNPPPAQRKMVGDLVYLEVHSLEGTTLHVTCSTSGFFINGTKGHDAFDPEPSKKHCFAHTLRDLLAAASPLFERCFEQLVRSAWSEEALAGGLADADPWEGLLSPNMNNSAGVAPVLPDGTGGGGTELYACSSGSVPLRHCPWIQPGAPAPSKGRKSPKGHGGGHSQSVQRHAFNLNRAEDTIAPAFGMDDRGVLRDWNEEYQASKAMPSVSVRDRALRARTLVKVYADFVDAAVAGAAAVVNGFVLPINPSDAPATHVFVFNSIFFSMNASAEDVAAEAGGAAAAGSDGDGESEAKEGTASAGAATATDADGELPAAGFVSCKHDLVGVRALNEIDIPGLHTLATVIVDYLGHRVVCQSIIPGILQGEHNSRLVYGTMDNGKTLTSDPAMHEKMRQAAQKLMMAERLVYPLGCTPETADDGSRGETKAGTAAAASDSAAAVAAAEDGVSSAVLISGGSTTEPQLLCGPIECKGIQGSDGRHYVLDFVRITPRDVVWSRPSSPEEDAVKAGAKGAKETAESPTDDVNNDENAPLFRHELVRAYARWREAKFRRKVMETVKQENEDSTDAATTSDAAAAAAAVSTPAIGDVVAETADKAANKATTDKADDTAAAGTEGVETKTEADSASTASAEKPSSSPAEQPATPQQFMMLPSLALNVNVHGKHFCSRPEPEDSSAATSVGEDGAPTSTTEATATAATGEKKTSTPTAAAGVDAVVVKEGVLSAIEVGKVEETRVVDEAETEDVGRYLVKIVIPTFILEMQRGSVNLVDGNSLVDAMHTRGINLRYLGGLARDINGLESANQRQIMPPGTMELIETEMVCRAARRLTNSMFRACPSTRRAPGAALSQLMSLMLGTPSSSSSSVSSSSSIPAAASGKQQKQQQKQQQQGRRGGGGAAGRNAQRAAGGVALALPSFADGGLEAQQYLPMCHADMWAKIGELVKTHYRYDLTRSSHFASNVGNVGNAGNAGKAGGESKGAKDGAGDSGKSGAGAPEVKVAQPEGSAPPRGSEKLPAPQRDRLDSLMILRRFCQIMGVQVVSRDYDFLQEQPVTVRDVMHIVPVVKHAMPRCPFPESTELLRQGRIQLQRGQLAQANDWVQESLMFFYQVVGPFHRDVAVACATQAMILHASGDAQGAILQQRRAVMLYELLRGVDSGDTITAYGNLAYLHHIAGEMDKAAALTWRCIYLLSLAAGPQQNDVTALYLKLGVIYQDTGMLAKAMSCFREAIVCAGNDVLKAAECLHHLAVAFGVGNNFREALQQERKVFAVYKALCGEQDARCQESGEWLKRFTNKAVEFQRKTRANQEAIADADADAGARADVLA